MTSTSGRTRWHDEFGFSLPNENSADLMSYPAATVVVLNNTEPLNSLKTNMKNVSSNGSGVGFSRCERRSNYSRINEYSSLWVGQERLCLLWSLSSNRCERTNIGSRRPAPQEQ
jgi:hypothetical protein